MTVAYYVTATMTAKSFIVKAPGSVLLRCHHTRHNVTLCNDTRHNNTQHNDKRCHIQHNDTQHNNIKCDTQQNETVRNILLNVVNAECHNLNLTL